MREARLDGSFERSEKLGERRWAKSTEKGRKFPSRLTKSARSTRRRPSAAEYMMGRPTRVVLVGFWARFRAKLCVSRQHPNRAPHFRSVSRQISPNFDSIRLSDPQSIVLDHVNQSINRFPVYANLFDNSAKMTPKMCIRHGNPWQILAIHWWVGRWGVEDGLYNLSQGNQYQ